MNRFLLAAALLAAGCNLKPQSEKAVAQDPPFVLPHGPHIENDVDCLLCHVGIDKATKLDAKNPIAFFGKAEAGLGIPTLEADDIVSWYRKAIELEPDNAQFHEAIASMCMDLGRFNEAEQAYNKAAELDKDNAPFYYSEFAVNYRSKAPVAMEQFLDDKTRAMIANKALDYALKALNMSRDEAKKLL